MFLKYSGLFQLIKREQENSMQFLDSVCPRDPILIVASLLMDPTLMVYCQPTNEPLLNSSQPNYSLLMGP
jgi:hypothetical protein